MRQSSELRRFLNGPAASRRTPSLTEILFCVVKGTKLVTSSLIVSDLMQGREKVFLFVNSTHSFSFCFEDNLMSQKLLIFISFLISLSLASIPSTPISHSGWLNVLPSESAQLFYWIVESEGNVATDPVVLWMSGGLVPFLPRLLTP